MNIKTGAMLGLISSLILVFNSLMHFIIQITGFWGMYTITNILGLVAYILMALFFVSLLNYFNKQ